MKKHNKGFTLIEMMIVFAIAAIILASLFPPSDVNQVEPDHQEPAKKLQAV
jgi:prepilin-type N-terminal cleavage/methylation domain-containing protein